MRRQALFCWAGLVAALCVTSVECFSSPCLPQVQGYARKGSSLSSPSMAGASRRDMLRLAGASLGAVVVGRQNPANAIFEGPATEWYRPEGEAGVVPKYKGDEWKGPTWPKPADEPSISWTEFIKAMADKDVIVVDFVGKNGEKVYAWRQSTQDRIRVGDGLPDETTPPPPSEDCAACLKSCPPEDKTCSCLSVCGGRNDWNSPLYTAKTIKRAGVPFRYTQKDDKNFGNPVNMWRKWVMFDGPISAGLI